MSAAQNDVSVENLQMIKEEFTKFKDYQNYLNGMKDMSLKTLKQDKPKVKILKTTVM